jgi:hypothetical protein
MRELNLAVARDHNSRMQRMGATGERQQLLHGLVAAGRLVEETVTKRQGLIRTDDMMALPGAGHSERLGLCEMECDFVRRDQARFLLDRTLVDIGRHRVAGKAGIGEQHAPRLALRRQDQGQLAAPETAHDPHSANLCRCRSE